MRFEPLEKRKLLSAWAAPVPDALVDSSPVAEVGHPCPSGQDLQVHPQEHSDLLHLLGNKAKGDEEWFLLLSGLVALMPADTPKTTGNVVAFANGLIGNRPVNRLKRDAVNYALRKTPSLRERVGMVLPRARKRTRQEWIDLLESVIRRLPDGTPPTVSNIALHSDGLLTPQTIRNAIMWHELQPFKEGWMKRDHEVPRSREGWKTLLRHAVAELPAGVPPTSNEIETLTFGQIRRRQIASALHRFDLPYREVGLVRETIVAKPRQDWMDLLEDSAAALPAHVSPTPYHVGPRVCEKNGAEVVRDVLWYYDIDFAQVGMVPLPQTKAEWLAAIGRARKNLEPGTTPAPRAIAAGSRHEFTLPELKQAMKPLAKGGFGIRYEEAGLQRETPTKRSLEERLQLIESAAGEIFEATGDYATPQDVSAHLSRSLNERFTASQVVAVIRKADGVSYEDLNMITSKHGPHVQVHSRAQAIGLQGEMLDGDRDGVGARFVAGRSRSIAPDARLDVEDALLRARLMLPQDTARLVDDVVAKLRMESDLLYDIDALAESLNKSPEQVQLTLQALHEVFGEESWDDTPDAPPAAKAQAKTPSLPSAGMSQEARNRKAPPSHGPRESCPPDSEQPNPTDRLLRHLAVSLAQSPARAHA